jgi:CRP-like cAMP-binding protein
MEVITSLRELASTNRLLNAYDSASRVRINPCIERVQAKLGDVLCEAGGVCNHVYFPDGAVLSLLTVLKDGRAIETANIGREGAFGLGAAMSTHYQTCFNRCIVQMAGGLLRVPTWVLRTEFESNTHIRDLFGAYAGALFAQIQQTVACNALHTTRQRICRWLLMMHDRADGEELSYTHEFLAEMLGANRKSVTLAAQALQKEGMINYSRGKIRVLDRCSLEKASCECYAVIKRRYDVFLSPSPHAVRDNREDCP